MYQLPAVSNELTKTQIKIIAEDSVSRLIDNGNLVESSETFSKVEMLIKEIKSNKDYIDNLRDEVSKFGKQVITSSGTKIELAEVGVKYDYSNCGDETYKKMLSQFEILETAIKERQDFLKTIPLSGIEVLYDDEIVRLYPPSKSSTSSIKTTISK